MRASGYGDKDESYFISYLIAFGEAGKILTYKIDSKSFRFSTFKYVRDLKSNLESLFFDTPITLVLKIDGDNDSYYHLTGELRIVQWSDPYDGDGPTRKIILKESKDYESLRWCNHHRSILTALSYSNSDVNFQADCVNSAGRYHDLKAILYLPNAL